MPGEGASAQPAQPAPSRELQQKPKQFSVPPPRGKIGNCKGLHVKGQGEAENQPTRRNSPWRGCSHLEEGTIYSLPKDAISFVSYQECVCSEAPPCLNSHKGGM